MTRNNSHTLVFERNPVESSRELQETQKVGEDTVRGRVKEKIKIKKKNPKTSGNHSVVLDNNAL